MTSTRRSDGAAQVQAIALCLRAIERRREALENLRRLAVHLEAASILDTRADHSNPTLAALLRERADERRRIAEVIRAHLDNQPGDRVGWARQVSRTVPTRVVPCHGINGRLRPGQGSHRR